MDLDRASALELKALADARRRENRNGPSAVLHLPSNTYHIADDAKGCSSKAQVQIQGQARPSRSIIRNQASGFEEPLWHTTEDEMVCVQPTLDLLTPRGRLRRQSGKEANVAAAATGDMYGGHLVELLAQQLVKGWALRRLTARGALIATTLYLDATPGKALVLVRSKDAGDGNSGNKRYSMPKLAHVVALQPGRRLVNGPRRSSTDTAGVRQVEALLRSNFSGSGGPAEGWAGSEPFPGAVMLVFKGEGALVLVTHDFEEAALLRGCFNSVGAIAAHGEGVSNGSDALALALANHQSTHAEPPASPHSNPLGQEIVGDTASQLSRAHINGQAEYPANPPRQVAFPADAPRTPTALVFPSSQVLLPSLTPWVSERLVRNLGTVRNMPTDSLDRPLGRIDAIGTRGSGGDVEAGKGVVPYGQEEEKQLSVSPLRESFPRLDFTFESTSSNATATTTSSTSFGPLITEGPIIERPDSSIARALHAPGTSAGPAVTFPRAPSRHWCRRLFRQEKPLPVAQPAVKLANRPFKAGDVVEVTFDAHLRIEVVTAGLPSRQLRLPVPGVYEPGTFLRGRVLAYHAASSSRVSEHSHNNHLPSHFAQYSSSFDDHDGSSGNSSSTIYHHGPSYDVVYLDGPYDDDEQPDGSVRLVLDPGLEHARRSAAAARQMNGGGVSAAGGRGGAAANRDGGGSVATRLILKGVPGELVSEDLKSQRRFFIPWFIVLISVCQLCAYLAAVIWSTSTDSLDSSSGSGKSWKTSFANALTPSAVAFTPVAPLETDGFENSCADRRSLFGPGGGRLFAHQFAHDGPWHLVANLALQLIFGLTIHLPSHYLLLVYEGGVCVGAITAATWLCNPWELALGLVGCSGGVYAILGLHAADLLLCPKEDSHDNSSQAHSGRTPPKQETYRSSRLLALAVVVVADITGTLLQDEGVEVSLESESGQSSWATHAGGGLFGLLVGLSGLLPYTGSNCRKPHCILSDATNTSSSAQSPREEEDLKCSDRLRCKWAHCSFVTWAARGGLIVFVGGGIWWYALQDPPSPLIKGLRSDETRASSMPCCWQLRSCSGLDQSDYGLFRCAARAALSSTNSSSSGSDSSWVQELWRDGVVIETCAGLMEAAAYLRL